MTGLHPSRGALVGDDLSLAPYQSAFGCVARLARLNQIRSSAEFSELLGIKLSTSQTLLQSLLTSHSQQEALAGTLGIPKPAEWEPSFWYPFQGSIPESIVVSRVRYCPACIRLGFHSNLHQLPWMLSCPWHRTSLRVGCPRCGKEPNTTARSRTRLLTCECGLDLINESASALQRGPHQGAAELQAAYLDWCAEERKSVHLVHVPGAPFDSRKLSCLVTPPPLLCQPSKAFRQSVRSYRPARRLDAPGLPQAVRELEAGRPAMIDYAEVPAIKHIVANVAAWPAVAELSPLDRARLGLPETSAGDQSLNATLGVGALRRFVRPQLFHPTHLSFLAGINDVGVHQDGDGAPNGMRASVWTRLQLAFLARAFAEGLMVAALGRHNPALPRGYFGPSPIALVFLRADAEVRLMP
jgi:hypothetical protein